MDVAVGEKKANTLASNFIDITEGGDNGNRGTWKRLLEAGQVYFNDTAKTDPFVTNIAAYSVSDDVYTLAKVEDASLRVDYEVQELTGIKTTSLTAKTLTAGDNTLQTTTDTVYYLVVKTVKGLEITTWTGYANGLPRAPLWSPAPPMAMP